MNRSPHFNKVSEKIALVGMYGTHIDVGLDASGHSPGSGQDFADGSGRLSDGA